MRAQGRHSVRSPRRESSPSQRVVGVPRGAVAGSGFGLVIPASGHLFIRLVAVGHSCASSASVRATRVRGTLTTLRRAPR